MVDVFDTSLFLIGITKNWQRYQCSLMDGWLLYKPENPKKKDEVAKKISIVLCSIRKVDEEKGKFVFEIRSPMKKTPLTFQAESEQEREKWLTALTETISVSINNQNIQKKKANSAPVRINPKDGFKILQEVPGNRECADCTASDPDWAAINHGILICIKCSGIHRGLGVDISKVRDKTDVKTIKKS